MDFVPLNKQKHAISSPDKILASSALRAHPLFVMTFLEFSRVGQNFVKVKHTGCTHL